MNEVRCVEVREPGQTLQGYAILLAGVWDGWKYIADSPGRRLVIVSMGLDLEQTIAAVRKAAGLDKEGHS
jgi:hypothetical protein